MNPMIKIIYTLIAPLFMWVAVGLPGGVLPSPFRLRVCGDIRLRIAINSVLATSGFI